MAPPLNEARRASRTHWAPELDAASSDAAGFSEGAGQGTLGKAWGLPQPHCRCGGVAKAINPSTRGASGRRDRGCAAGQLGIAPRHQPVCGWAGLSGPLLPPLTAVAIHGSREWRALFLTEFSTKRLPSPPLDSHPQAAQLQQSAPKPPHCALPRLPPAPHCPRRAVLPRPPAPATCPPYAPPPLFHSPQAPHLPPAAMAARLATVALLAAAVEAATWAPAAAALPLVSMVHARGAPARRRRCGTSTFSWQPRWPIAASPSVPPDISTMATSGAVAPQAPRCPTGYPPAPEGTPMCGSFCCTRPSTYPEGCMTIVKKFRCRPGSSDNGCFCGRGALSRSSSSMSCADGYFLRNGLCRLLHQPPFGVHQYWGGVLPGGVHPRNELHGLHSWGDPQQARLRVNGVPLTHGVARLVRARGKGAEGAPPPGRRPFCHTEGRSSGREGAPPQGRRPRAQGIQGERWWASKREGEAQWQTTSPFYTFIAVGARRGGSGSAGVNARPITMVVS